jgi:hypothetical protein
MDCPFLKLSLLLRDSIIIFYISENTLSAQFFTSKHIEELSQCLMFVSTHFVFISIRHGYKPKV